MTDRAKPRKTAQKKAKTEKNPQPSSNFGAMSLMVEALRSAGRL